MRIVEIGKRPAAPPAACCAMLMLSPTKTAGRGVAEAEEAEAKDEFFVLVPLWVVPPVKPTLEGSGKRSFSALSINQAAEIPISTRAANRGSVPRRALPAAC